MLENVMFCSKKKLFFLFFIIWPSEIFASIKNDIIKNLEIIDNVSFNFEQNINGKIEKGNCTLEYPKKIFCKYNQDNQKILVSNGRSLVIKTLNSYYIYPIKKTPLNYILDKKFLVNEILNAKERTENDKFISYYFFIDENKINIFFDRKNYNLIGWQTLDIFQNLSITYLNSIIKNKELKKNLFKLPSQN